MDDPASTSPDASLLVIVPAYNESASIARVVADVHQHMPEADIVVIDDGSRDDTADRVPPPARVIRLPFNLGIGAAMQTGYRFAQARDYAMAAQVDGDGQHPADQLPTLVQTMRDAGADLVVGSRFLTADREYRQSASRMAGIRVLRGVIRLLSGLKITDCTSGYRLANRSMIDAFARFYPDDYPEPEVVLLARRAGYRIAECQVRMSPRTTGRTSIPFWRGVFYVVKVTLALLLDMLRDPWPPKRQQPRRPQHVPATEAAGFADKARTREGVHP